MKYQESFCVETWYLHMWKEHVLVLNVKDKHTLIVDLQQDLTSIRYRHFNNSLLINPDKTK